MIVANLLLNEKKRNKYKIRVSEKLSGFLVALNISANCVNKESFSDLCNVKKGELILICSDDRYYNTDKYKKYCVC